MKYNIGDKVRIKSLDWYNENKDEFNDVLCGEHYFTGSMKKLCSEIFEISNKTGDGYFMLEDKHKYVWTDEMIEGLAEEETKFGTASNPIEIKSNANCLTQERVDETKPEFKIGDKITNGKTQLTILTTTSNKYIVEDNFGECGTLYFNTQDDWKLVEEETKPKFKVSDKVKWYNHTCNITSIDTNENTYIYLIMYDDGREDRIFVKWVPESELTFEDDMETKPKYEDEVNGEYYSTPKYLVRPSGYQFVDENGNVINATKIVLEKANTLKIQSNNMETETHRGYCTTEVETTNESKKVAWFTFWDNDFADKVELDLSDRELIQEDGKWFVVKKKKEYPKTYEECCKVLHYAYGQGITMRGVTEEEEELFRILIVLKRCRDAYWKIAGEEMGLGKPWKPRWNDSYQKKWIINFYQDEINLTNGPNVHFVLAFPSAEMRDAFYENFKELIAICKELL